MTSTMGVNLAKVTITTSRRGIDVALPEDVTVAELLPYILRHSGDGVPDDGERHGGWALRRPTGERLDPERTLAGQNVRDGEVLHLAPGQEEWPEIEYDDLVEAVASGARRYGRSWGNPATRRCGLAVSAAVLALGPVSALAFEPPWLVPGVVLLSVAWVLTALGIVVARVLPDAIAGAIFAGSGLLDAFLGGFLVTAPAHAGLADFGVPQILLGCVALTIFGILSYLGVAAAGRVFVAAITVGLLGTLAAALGNPMASDGAASVVATLGIALLPAYPLLAIRLGRVPVPQLPQRSADLLRESTAPPAPEVFAAAARTDEILSGFLLGLAVISVPCAFLLAVHGGGAWQVMALLVGVALLLRGRLFPVPRQRIPLLVAGVVVLAILVELRVSQTTSNMGVAVLLIVLSIVGVSVAFAGIVYSRKSPSPYLGRIADIVDVVAILALLPFAGYITGFFGYVQGLMASIG